MEGSRGLFTPVMQWRGNMPVPFLRRGILVMERNFGGNIPIVYSWAWVWSPLGPVRLDAGGAVYGAIEKVAPGHSGCGTAFDWDALFCLTWTYIPET